MGIYLEREDGVKFQVRENKTALVCGVLAIGLAFFIMAMRLLHPSVKGGGALLYLPLLCMALGGMVCFLMYFNRKLVVDEMELCYVNWLGRMKQFTLDEIGFGQIGTSGDMNRVVLYDLLGRKLCKLETGMRGLAELYQYLLDNGVRLEFYKSKVNQSSGFMRMIDAFSKETSVCEEEIRKCAELFYEEAGLIFHEWEKNHQYFEAIWEFGFVEYTAEDLERKCPLYMYPSSVDKPLEHIPETYECVLEAYLKREDEYVVNKSGEAVGIVLPYLSKTKSYQIGEKTRIRKMNEESLKEWLQWKLEVLNKELPRHKYHTEMLVMGHELRTTAGITEEAENLGL